MKKIASLNKLFSIKQNNFNIQVTNNVKLIDETKKKT